MQKNQSTIKIIVTVFLSIFLFTSCLTTSNNYMVRDTDEFNNVTVKVSGEWSLVSFLQSGNDLMKSVYEKGNLSFSFDDEKVKISYEAKESYIADKLLDWKKKYPKIKIDSYKVVQTASWKVDSKGEAIFFGETTTDLVIIGSGENFESFYSWEKSKIEMSKSAGQSFGLLGAMVAKKMTKTESLFPKISSGLGYWINFDSKAKMLNLRKGKNDGAFDIVLKKKN